MKQLNVGKLRYVPIREVFPHEAHHFSVWLAENIDALSRSMGVPLVVEKREVSVGKFRADLLCRDAQGNGVVIENQLEISNHDHFGKIMTYMGNLKANTAVWITSEPRVEHQSAVEFFNSKRNLGLAFYLIKIEAIQIDNSRPAPLFTVITRPYDQPAPVAETEVEINNDESKLNVQEARSTSDFSPVWCVYPRRDKETYDLFLKKNTVGLGFGRIGDLREIGSTPEDFRSAYQASAPELSTSQIRTLYPMFFSLIHRMKTDDLVIYPPTWLERTIYVGRVSGEYNYRSLRLWGYRHVRPVTWLTSLPRDNFSPEALKGIGVNLALFQIRNEAFLNELKQQLAVE